MVFDVDKRLTTRVEPERKVTAFCCISMTAESTRDICELLRRGVLLSTAGSARLQLSQRAPNTRQTVNHSQPS